MGSHKLNSVKWYKDGLEFFRYSPMTHPTILKFPVDGVTISDKKFTCNQFYCSIQLENLSQRSSGAYRCEVSGDAPEFKLISKTANMTVAALPQHDPFINGMTQSYRFGDFFVANCTSDWSSPPATLSWYINDNLASPELLEPEHETTMNTDGFVLHSRSLEIRFHIHKARLINTGGELKMKCLANIIKIPSQARESTRLADILSEDGLHNQKLVNWKNSGHKNNILVMPTILFTSFLVVLTNIYREYSPLR